MSKKPSFKLYMLFSIMFTASIACLSSNISSSSQTTAATSIPSTGGGDGTLFFDDFNDPDSGWDRYFDEEGSTDYRNSKYRINVTDTSQIFWANPGKSFTDVRVEVDATFVDGEADNSFGIICRHIDTDNFYALLVSSDGYFAIRKRVNGSPLEMISGDGFTYSDDIPQGEVRLRLAAECVGDTLRLYVNDILLSEVTDGDLQYGDVGLIATTFEVDHTTIDFDNFTVLEP